jgi:TctA family transporter
MVLLLPISFGLEPVTGIVMLAGIMCARCTTARLRPC